MIRLPNLLDAEGLFVVVDRNRDRLRQYLPWLDMNKTSEDTRKFIQEALQGHARGDRFDNIASNDKLCADMKVTCYIIFVLSHSSCDYSVQRKNMDAYIFSLRAI